MHIVIEKSLKSERYDHQHTKYELKNEREQIDKSVMETNLKLTSLQQHYKLLKSKHDDLDEEYTKSKEQYRENIMDLNDKLKSTKNQLQQEQKERETEIEHWKVSI